MKITGIAGSGMLLLALLSGAHDASGQEIANLSRQEIKVKKKTVMEQYEPELILTVDDRIRLKEERIATIRKRRGIIDTLCISDRKRRKLLKELYHTPNSDRWDKLIADIQFEDEAGH
jgi:hypothetical protein